MGRLVLNVLLSFAQFEREMISERIRDKVAASRRRGKWSGGMPLLGYTVENTKLVVDEIEADRVRQIFSLYIEHRSLLPVVKELRRRGWTTKQWVTKKGDHRGGRAFTKNAVYKLLTNVTYIGKIRYKDETHEGEHDGIVPLDLFRRVQTNSRPTVNSGGTGVRNKHNALLKGLIWCKACGRPMTHSYSCKGKQAVSLLRLRHRDARGLVEMSSSIRARRRDRTLCRRTNSNHRHRRRLAQPNDWANRIAIRTAP